MNTTMSGWRNFGIIAHIDAGKTTLTERLLHVTGTIHRVGEVHDGATTTDHMALERERGITIGAAAVQCTWTPVGGEEHRLTLIDTPGHVDFAIEVERSLRVLDGAVAVFCGVGGVQPQSETVWRQADRYQIPRLIFVNKLDRPGADFGAVLEQIRSVLGATALGVVMPDLGKDGAVLGTVQLVARTWRGWVEEGEEAPQPWSLEQTARFEPMREALVETLVNHDDELANLWLQGDPVNANALEQALRRATLAGRVVPALAGSAFKHRGVRDLLDAAVAYLPSPLDRPLVVTEGGTVARATHAPVVGLVFKVVHQQHGSLAFVRLYGGSLQVGQDVYVPRLQHTRRVTRLGVVMADNMRAVSMACSGEIVAVTGLRDVLTGDTLCSPEHLVVLEPITTSPPVLAWRLTPNNRADLVRLGDGLARLSQEDPSFQVGVDPETGETLVWGMGELHLEIMVERLRRESKVDVTPGSPQVAYQETPSAGADGVVGCVDKQTGGKGQYASITITIQPRDDGQVCVSSAIVGGAVSQSFLAAAEKGIREALQQGPRGFLVVGIDVVMVDGKMHAVDSSDHAFVRAGRMAMEAALAQAGTTLLEPMMRMDVHAPSGYVGSVLGDLQRRGGVVRGVEEQASWAHIQALAPLARLDGYTTSLRSLTQGRAHHHMAFACYQPVRETLIHSRLSP